MPPSKSIPAKTRTAVRARDNRICTRCGQGGYVEIHHRINRSQGGDHRLSNLVSLCMDCHVWITGHPREAKSTSWTVSRWVQGMDALDVLPVLTLVRPDGSLFLVDDDGARTEVGAMAL